MSMSRTRNTRGRRGPARRKRAAEWFDTNFLDLQLASNTNTGTSLTVNIEDDEKKGLTIVRLIINLSYRTTTVGVGQRIAVGVCLLNDDAVAAAAIPDPETDDEKAGWMFRDGLHVINNAAADGASMGHIKVDIRSARKFPDEDFDMFIIQETGPAATNVQVNGIIRLLALKS